jgi:hypothetical protein
VQNGQHHQQRCRHTHTPTPARPCLHARNPSTRKTLNLPTIVMPNSAACKEIYSNVSGCWRFFSGRSMWERSRVRQERGGVLARVLGERGYEEQTKRAAGRSPAARLPRTDRFLSPFTARVPAIPGRAQTHRPHDAATPVALPLRARWAGSQGSCVQRRTGSRNSGPRPQTGQGQ